MQLRRTTGQATRRKHNSGSHGHSRTVSAASCTSAHTVSTWATWQRRDERQGNVEVEGMEERQEMKGEAGKQKEDRNIWNPIPIWSSRPQKWDGAPPVNMWSQISNIISQMGLRSSGTVQMLANSLIKNVSWKCQRRLETLQANSGEHVLFHQYGVTSTFQRQSVS